VVDFLRSRGVDDLDGIVVSNPDADHIGGFVDVLEAFEVGVVYVSGDPKGTLTYNTFLRGVREEGSKLEVVRAREGQRHPNRHRLRPRGHLHHPRASRGDVAAAAHTRTTRTPHQCPRRPPPTKRPRTGSR
jgi:phosphoribosyl 1,2-cyclic phosphodiesterase